MGVTYNNKIPTEGLIFMVDAANKRSYPGTGTKWYDISGAQINGTPFTMNMVGYGSNPVFSNDHGGAFYFNSSTSRSAFDAESSQRSAGHMNGYVRDCTVFQWIRPEGNANSGRMYTLDSRLDGNTFGVGLGFDRYGTAPYTLDPFHFFSPHTGGYDEANDGTADFASGQPYMIGLRREGDTMQILSPDSHTWRTPAFASTSGGSGYVNLSNLRIGAYEGGTASSTANYWYKGYIYNTMIWDRPLSQEETDQVYNSFRTRFGV